MIITSLNKTYNVLLPKKLIRLCWYNDKYYEYISVNNNLSKGTINRLKINDISNIVLHTDDGYYFNLNIKSYGIIRFYRPNILTTIIPADYLENYYNCKKHLDKIYKKLKKERKYRQILLV